MARNVLITCAPPNPNGDLHLGHLSGPFMGADVLRRYLRARGVPVRYVSYTDDHSCYVPRRGAELGWDARTTAFRYTRRIEESLTLAGMLPDYYAHPHREPLHDALVREHFLALRDQGVVTERDVPTPYCTTCERHVYEAYVRGACRFCAAPSDGTYCEECGLPQDPGGVLDGRCVTCGGAPETRWQTRLVVRLAPFADRLAALYADATWRPRVRDYCLRMVERGLPDVPISRRDDYGVPVPLDGWEGHVLDTWFSGVFGYMAATAAHGAALGAPEEWRTLWRDPDTELVHFIGFDCGFSHAVLWPSLLMGLGGYVTPAHVISNEFYTLEGEKFSTSRGHAIWGSEFLRDAHPDAVRLHLCLTAPERAKSDFRLDDFARTVGTVLVDGVEGWASAVLRRLAEGHGSLVPDVRRADWPAGLRELVETLPGDLARHLEPDGFSPRAAAARLTGAVEQAAEQLRSVPAAPPRDTAAALAAHAELLGVVAAVSGPLMPTWSAHAARQVGVPAGFDGVDWPGGGALVPGGTRVAAAYPRLFAPRP
ncbi:MULTISPECIES: class I tRNA ligase family protein [Streptomyces]|uniref:class I tRNA ligase family protein n=1 Tax=Streptomyces TaxID=1883 RepID=UPI002248E251|nr:class I tRNA ligase family protein [Streptomyces sp. JHD 1]MCX2970959.1 class I tRNA ligase family protein [Streptomyces sp. JHD 1]